MGSGFRTFTAGEVLTASNVQNYLQDQVVMTFAGSAARSSAIGTANFEEGMISYLTDTDKVEAYNGTNWVQVGSSNQGLTLINTTSFSGVSSQAVSSVFSATYSHYVVHLELTAVATADADIHLKLRATSTDMSNAYYQIRQRINSSTTTITEILNGSNGFHIGEWDFGTNAAIYNSQVDIINPFEASRMTSMKHLFGSAQQNGNMAATYGAGHQGDATSFNGFNIIASAGTMTGKISTYAYNI